MYLTAEAVYSAAFTHYITALPYSEQKWVVQGELKDSGMTSEQMAKMIFDAYDVPNHHSKPFHVDAKWTKR